MVHGKRAPGSGRKFMQVKLRDYGISRQVLVNMRTQLEPRHTKGKKDCTGKLTLNPWPDMLVASGAVAHSACQISLDKSHKQILPQVCLRCFR